MLRSVRAARRFFSIGPVSPCGISPISNCVSRRFSALASSSRTIEPSSAAPTYANSRTEPPLEEWCGADVDVVMHDSLETMVPSKIVTLPGGVFNAPIRPDLVHRTVIWQLAKRRAGTAKTKSRSEVAGSGRKIRPQKGSGRSRQGAITSPIFRGGGRAQGPVPRDYSFTLPYNVRRNALRSVLTSKLQCGQLWVVDSAAIGDGRTRSVVDFMMTNKWKSALIVDHCPEGRSGVDKSLHIASHNVRAALAMNALGLNVYDALSFDMLVLSNSALQHIRDRFSSYEWVF